MTKSTPTQISQFIVPIEVVEVTTVIKETFFTRLSIIYLLYCLGKRHPVKSFESRLFLISKNDDLHNASCVYREKSKGMALSPLTHHELRVSLFFRLIRPLGVTSSFLVH